LEAGSVVPSPFPQWCTDTALRRPGLRPGHGLQTWRSRRRRLHARPRAPRGCRKPSSPPRTSTSVNVAVAPSWTCTPAGPDPTTEQPCIERLEPASLQSTPQSLASTTLTPRGRLVVPTPSWGRPGRRGTRDRTWGLQLAHAAGKEGPAGRDAGLSRYADVDSVESAYDIRFRPNRRQKYPPHARRDATPPPNSPSCPHGPRDAAGETPH